MEYILLSALLIGAVVLWALSIPRLQKRWLNWEMKQAEKRLKPFRSMENKD